MQEHTTPPCQQKQNIVTKQEDSKTGTVFAIERVGKLIRVEKCYNTALKNYTKQVSLV